jgi:hypothetical protein
VRDQVPSCIYYALRGCIQKFSDWVDKEIKAYNYKHSLRRNTKGYDGKTHYTDSHNMIKLHLVADNSTICSSRSRRLVRKLLDTLSNMKRVITNDVSDSYQQIYVIAHIICNHLVSIL